MWYVSFRDPYHTDTLEIIYYETTWNDVICITRLGLLDTIPHQTLILCIVVFTVEIHVRSYHTKTQHDLLYETTWNEVIQITLLIKPLYIPHQILNKCIAFDVVWSYLITFGYRNTSDQ